MSLLIYPPFADPTQSYPALPLLKGYLKELKREIQIVDFNLLALLDAAEGKGVDEIAHFCDRTGFFDARTYARAEKSLQKLYATLSQQSGCLIDNNRHFDPRGPWNLKKLKTYFEKNKSPFHRFYMQKIGELLHEKTALVGINLTFASQIPEAFYLAMLIKKRFPKVFIVLGGALAGQIVTQISRRDIEALFTAVDGICYFEGGPALDSLLTQLEGNGKIVEEIPNLLFLQDGYLVQGPTVSMDYKSAPLPDFDGFSLNKYLAPSPIILFHPSAGCYWNRCSFCRYGFNQEHGKQYREMDAEYAVDQIQSLKDNYQVSRFYMSADVLSPRFSVKLASALVKRNVGIKWSTDLRIEKSYTRDQTDLLYKSGLVSVAFGIESASDRLLKKMNKGIDRALIEQVNRLFHDSAVATCWMMFHYHPSETLEEAEESVRFLEQQKNKVSLFIIGEFGLTPHSNIFNNPKDYQIKNITYHPDDFFMLYPVPEYESLPKSSALHHAGKLDKMTARLASNFALRPYPFAGAVSTHHSMLYFIQYGQSAFRRALVRQGP